MCKLQFGGGAWGRSIVAMASQTDLPWDYEAHFVALSKSKLKSSIRTSTLLAGFALVGIVEIEIEPGVPVALLIPFAIVSAVLIFVHLLSLMLAICLLPELEALGGTPHPVLYTYGLVVAKSFSVQFCWVLSNIIGILLFLVELILIAFIKFYPIDSNHFNNIYAAVCTLMTIIILSVTMSPILIYYTRTLSKYKIQLHQEQLNQAQRIMEGINQQNGPLMFRTNSSLGHTHSSNSASPA